MKKQSMIVGGIFLSIATVGSSLTWVPGTVEGVRNFMIAPALEAIKEKSAHDKVIMFSMKQYDIRTDELAEDCRILRNRINSLRKALGQVPVASEGFRQHLEEQIRDAEQQLQKKERMLDQAEDNDRDILETIHQATA